MKCVLRGMLIAILGLSYTYIDGSTMLSSAQYCSQVNIKTDFGATGNELDDAFPAFVAFRQWAVKQTCAPDLFIPAGTYAFRRASSRGVDPLMFRGIHKLRVIGESGSLLTSNVSGGTRFYLGGYGYIQNVGGVKGIARIQTANAGDTTLTLVRISDAPGFVPDATVLHYSNGLTVTNGSWLSITALDTQGYGGPSNPYYQEFVQLTGVNLSTGVISLASPLKHSYLSTYPVYNVGGLRQGDQGGPATIYMLDDSWDLEHEYNGITVDQGAGQTYARGKSITVNNSTWIDANGLVPSQNQTIIFNRCSFQNASIEVDKWITNYTINNSTVRTLIFQSAAPDNFRLSNSTARLLGTPKNSVITNSHLPSLVLGTIAYGITETFEISDSVVNSLGVRGVLDSNINGEQWSFRGGVVSTSTSVGPVRWAIPGAHGFFNGSHVNEGAPFVVSSLDIGAGKTNVTTTLLDGVPNLPLQGGARLDLQAHPCPRCTFLNVTGNRTVEDLSQGEPNKPIFYHSKRTYAPIRGLVDNVTIWGALVSIKIDVIRPYTGTNSELITLDAIGQFGASVVPAGGSSSFTRRRAAIDLKTAGLRTITPGSVTGAPPNDRIDTFQAGDYFNQAEPFMETDISSECSVVPTPSVCPIVVIEMTMDQGF